MAKNGQKWSYKGHSFLVKSWFESALFRFVSNVRDRLYKYSMCISNASCVHHRDIMPTELTADEGPSFITSGQGDIFSVRTLYHAPQISLTPEAESR